MIGELEFLVNQMKMNENKLKEKEKKLRVRNKFYLLFFIPFLYMWVILAIGNYYLFHESLLGNIITVILIGIHIYVYIIFINTFLKEAKDEYQSACKAFENSKNKLDKYLIENNYEIADFYKNLSI